jgi:hypothetical protein
MRMSPIVVFALAVATVAALPPTSAEAARRHGRLPAYAGAVSYNVITPWYVGYYPSHYSYYKPDPRPPRVYYDYAYSCWRWNYWGC